MLTERQAGLLRLVVDHYVETAEPVGSKFLVEEKGLDISGATVRNELRELEEAGFLTHPHTSAGRIPTEAGYRYYVTHLMQPKKLKKQLLAEYAAVYQQGSGPTDGVKRLAKHMAEYAQNAIIVTFGSESIYYTGLSNLFSQPELREHGQSVNVSAMFDQCEERLPELGKLMQTDIHVFIGSQNPLGTFCGAVAVKATAEILMAFVGPMRMDYARSVALASHVRALLNT